MDTSRVNRSFVSSAAIDGSSPPMRLDQCAKHAQLRIVDVLPQPRFGSLDEQVTLRLKELGFLPGAQLSVIGFGLLGRDPLAVQINGTKFALRRTEASKISVERINQSEQ